LEGFVAQPEWLSRQQPGRLADPQKVRPIRRAVSFFRSNTVTPVWFGAFNNAMPNKLKSSDERFETLPDQTNCRKNSLSYLGKKIERLLK
jgi:hypothetical protein